MAIDKYLIDTFRHSSRTHDLVAGVFEAAGFEVSWIVPENEAVPGRRDVWAYYLKLSDQLQSLLGTSRELLVWVAEPPVFIAKSVMQAQAHIARRRPRLSEDFSLIVSTDEDVASKVEEVGQGMSTAYVGLSIGTLRALSKDKPGALVRSIQTKLFAKDLYYVSTAISSPHAFFGRRDLVNKIAADLSAASANVGLFGLRKMGKTSVMLRLAETIRDRGSLCWAHLDLQRIDALDPSPEFLLWSIGERLFDANQAVRKVGGYRMFGHRGVFQDVPNREDVVHHFDHDIRLFMRRSVDSKVTLLLDEVELMSQPRWGDGFVKIWRLLRALAQEFPGRISYFVTGTNPRCFESSKIGDKDNPAYNYFKIEFLGPLNRSDSRDMLVRLGRPMGMLWQDSAVERVSSLVGGHPFLLRVFGSLVHRRSLPRSKESVVGLGTIQEAVEPFLREMNSTLSQMVEVIEESYADEYQLLSLLAAGRVGEFRQLAEVFPADVAHLVGYGLVKEPDTATSLDVELLQTWMQRRGKARSSLSVQSEGGYQAGEEIEGYQVQSRIAQASGMARVYQCLPIGSKSGAESVAVKVLVHASMGALEREIVALGRITHPNVVRVLDYGKTVRGEAYLVMEYLNGRLLRHYCDRATRPDPERIEVFLLSICRALAVMHPNLDKQVELRSRGDLTQAEFDELEDARLEYLHRDIKPENIIVEPTRGPVLIDFGLACRVGTPVVTQSATQGYLPPDGVPGAWSEDTDLYQLGVTFLQVASGIGFDGRNIEDIRTVVREELPNSLGHTLLQLTEPERARRFASIAGVVNVLSVAPKASE